MGLEAHRANFENTYFHLDFVKNYLWFFQRSNQSIKPLAYEFNSNNGAKKRQMAKEAKKHHKFNQTRCIRTAHAIFRLGFSCIDLWWRNRKKERFHSNWVCVCVCLSIQFYSLISKKDFACKKNINFWMCTVFVLFLLWI